MWVRDERESKWHLRRLEVCFIRKKLKKCLIKDQNFK